MIILVFFTPYINLNQLNPKLDPYEFLVMSSAWIIENKES